jgi:hypothetical protein
MVDFFAWVYKSKLQVAMIDWAAAIDAVVVLLAG